MVLPEWMEEVLLRFEQSGCQVVSSKAVINIKLNNLIISSLKAWESD